MKLPSGGAGGHSPRGSWRGVLTTTEGAGFDAGTTSNTRRRGRPDEDEGGGPPVLDGGALATGADLGAFGSRGFLSLKIAARMSRGKRWRARKKNTPPGLLRPLPSPRIKPPAFSIFSVS